MVNLNGKCISILLQVQNLMGKRYDLLLLISKVEPISTPAVEQPRIKGVTQAPVDGTTPVPPTSVWETNYS
jgi:hypothetical protein